MGKDLLEGDEVAGVTPVNLTEAAAAAAAEAEAAAAAAAVERLRVEFGTMEMIFVSSANQGAHPDLATIALAKESHAPNGSPKPKSPCRLCT